MSHTIFCTRCSKRYPDRGSYLYHCPECDGIMDVEYDLAPVRFAWVPAQLAQRRGGLGRWCELLPVSREALVSLGEGDTPLVQAPSEALGCPGVHVYLKLEGCNPTGSFKDRAIAIGISKAREARARGVIISSTGNAGAALGAYSAYLGLPGVVLVPAATPFANLAQIAAYGVNLVRVEGDVSAPFHLACAAAEKLGWINLATTYQSPYPTEGDKTAGFELWMQLGWQVPDWVLVPVGDGPLLYACFKAFVELKELALVDRVPRFAAVQATGCAPIFHAWQAEESEVKAWDSPHTVAKGIADPLKGYAQDGTFTLQAVRSSGGIVLAVTDEEYCLHRRTWPGVRVCWQKRLVPCL